MLATSLLLTAREMQIAESEGRVRPLSGDIDEIRRYYGYWWIMCPDGWLRITDAHLTQRLDRIRQRLDIAEDDSPTSEPAIPPGSSAQP
jgi:hypothetical protein